MQLKLTAANRLVIFVAAAACISLAGTAAIVLGGSNDARYDRFGVREIYPSKNGGYEWHLNSTDPRNGFVISPAATLIDDAGNGTWKISRETAGPNDGVRMYVISPVMWKNIEMTGYVKLESYSFEEEFAWAARSGKHSPDQVCDATAYFGALGFSGNSWFQKKVFHGYGYTDKRYSNYNVDPLQGRWVGLKLVAYNIDSDRAVKLQLWLDDKTDNNWIKIAETVDSGRWNEDYPGACGRPADHIISDARPRVMFRVDNASFEFRNFSVREIAPPAS